MATPPIAAEVKLPDGTLWKNIVTEDKSKPAETLAEFRGNFKYNMIDKNVRAFNAEVPMFAQWDDHEMYNKLVAGRAAAEQRAPEDELPIEQRIAARGSREPSLPRIYAASPDGE